MLISFHSAEIIPLSENNGKRAPYVYHWDWSAFVIGILGIKIKRERERERENGVAAPTTLDFIPFSFHTRP